VARRSRPQVASDNVMLFASGRGGGGDQSRRAVYIFIHGSVYLTDYVYRAELGVVCGYNQFQSKVGVFERVWQRSYADSWDAADQAMLLQTGAPVSTEEMKTERLMEDIGVHKVLAERLPSVTKESASVSDVRAAERELVAEVQRMAPDLPKPVQQRIAQEVQRSVRTSYGTAQEMPTIQVIERQDKVQVKENNSRFYKRKVEGVLSPHSMKPVSVGGRVDGFKDGSLVEIKNRVRRLYDPLPLYDVVQFQCYLYVLDLPHGELIQRIKYSKECDDSARSTIQIERDEAFWTEEVVPRICSFVSALDTVSSDQDAAMNYLALADERDKAYFIAQLDNI
jgi:hypothetical protein